MARLSVFVLLATPACADATGAVSGGEPRWDAQARVDPSACAVSIQGGTTFADLYRDYLGPSGKGACGASVACHAPITGAMGFEQSGFGCADRDGCWSSLTADGDGGALLQPVGDVPTKLEWALRKQVPAGRNDMPSGSCQTFTTSDVQRIRSWIATGARND